MPLPAAALANRRSPDGDLTYWDTQSLHELLCETDGDSTVRSTERLLQQAEILPDVAKLPELVDEHGRPARQVVARSIDDRARSKRQQSLIVQRYRGAEGLDVLFANDGRGGRRWLYLEDRAMSNAEWLVLLQALVGDRPTVLWPTGGIVEAFRSLVQEAKTHDLTLPKGTPVRLGTMVYLDAEPVRLAGSEQRHQPDSEMTHLDRLEAESMHIIREVMALAENPVMLYSVGKDSSVMLHLARKAFAPSPPPFPLMHIDTRWKFQAMYAFREEMARQSGMDLIVHTNPEGIAKNVNPFDHGSALHTDIMKTQALKQALDKYQFDVAFGGARRDEEKSRAKERVFSFRNEAHRWDPKNQRPELWNLYNASKSKGESIRVFPLSNWTELDIWQYIYREQIPIVPLYFAEERAVVERDGMLMMVDDDRLQLFEGEAVELRRVRFRTLGCYPLTGAFESDADDLSSIVLELLNSRSSERQGRAIDSDSAASMEKKKQEGYF